jgi:hypothetical protein
MKSESMRGLFIIVVILPLQFEHVLNEICPLPNYENEE